MTLKEIKELINTVLKNKVSEVKVDTPQIKLKIKKD